MPFIVPAIAGALGLGLLGEILVGAALSVAMGAAARALAPKPKGLGGSSGMRLGLRVGPGGAREIPLGRCATDGELVYRGVFGPTKNEYLHLVFALGDAECDALETVYINGVAVSWNPSDETVAEYPGLMWIKFHNGAYGQDADADLVANSDGAITANDRGRGICYVRVKVKYDAEKFQSVPTFRFVLRGAKLYDWRKDTTNGGAGAHRWGQATTYEWSDNPIVQLYNWRRGLWLNGQRIAGMNAPAASLPVSIWTAAANACDELVSLAAGGTEKRYRAGGVVSTNATHRDVIVDLLAACAGQEIETAGVIKPIVGVAQTPVMTITDDDLISGKPVEISAKRPRNELVNAVMGTFPNPASLWERQSLPPRISSAAEIEDGNIRLDESYDLDMVSSQTQGQRILEVWRRRHRAQGRAKIVVRARLAALEAGDWIIWNSGRYGYDGSVWEVTAASLAADKTVALTLRAINAACYTWTTGDELSMTAPGVVPVPAPTYVSVSGLAVSLVSVAAGAAQGDTRPGIGITWTPPSDQSVVSLVLEFRKQGDTIALERPIQAPQNGQYVWIDGVQGGTRYEVRLKPVTSPPRATQWSSWVASAADTPVVTVTIPSGSIDASKLDAQTLFEISLDSALADSADSVNARIAELQADLAKASEAAHDGLARVHVEYLDRRASIQEFERVFVDANTAIAQQITTLETAVGTNSASVVDLSETVDGVRARRTVAVTQNGEVTGAIDLSGENGTSELVLLANVIKAAASVGGTTVPMFDSTVVGGQTLFHLHGDLIAKAIQAGTVNAGSIAALFGQFEQAAITGILTGGPSGKLVIDFTNGRIRALA